MTRSTLRRYWRSTADFRYGAASLISRRAALRRQLLRERLTWTADGYDYKGLHQSALHVDATGAVYFPIPKSACTTMKHVIAEHAPENERNVHSATLDGVRRLDESGMTLGELAAGASPCFTVVRDPVERFGSAYRNKIHSHRPSPLKRAVGEFLARPADEPISIDDLLAYVRETPPERLEPHVRPQWLCCGAGRIPFAMVGKVETLDHDIKAFAEAGLITADSLSRYAIRNSSAAASELDADLRRLRPELEQRYARDFELFGY